MKKLFIGCFVCLLSLVAFAQSDTLLKNGHPEHYFVKKGDNLWDISKKFLNNPWLWPEIWHVNPQVENPHLIFPGDKLNLVYIDGKPKLVAQRGEASRTVKLSPQVRISPIDNAIPAIPLDKINAFLTRSRILEDDQLDGAPYVLAGTNGRIISGAGDRLYARGEFEGNENVYGIFRRGKVFVDPETNEALGLEAIDIAAAKIVSTDGDVATLVLNRSNEEVRVEDRLLPFLERKVTATFYPSSPEADITGVIMAVEGGVSQVGTMDIITLNRGEREGLEVGHVLAIYKRGQVVKDQVTAELIKLPDVRSGLAMVFRTFDKMSFAIVLNASQPLSVEDIVKNP